MAQCPTIRVHTHPSMPIVVRIQRHRGGCVIFTRRSRSTTALIVGVVLAGLTTPPAGAMGTASVTGSFLRTTGVPIAQARVDLTDQYGNMRYSTLTGTNGRYRFTAVPPGQYKLRYQWPAFTEQWWPGKHDSYAAQTITVVDGAKTVVNETALPVGQLEVTITDSATGAPMSGVCVSGSGEHFISGCTDSLGRVLLGPARVGYYHLTAEPPAGYLYGSVDQYIRTEETTTASITMQREAVLEVTFIDAVTSQPVPGTCVGRVDEASRGVVDQYLDDCADQTGKLRLGMQWAGRTRLFVRPGDGVHGSQWVGTDGGTGDLELAAWHTLRFGETTRVTVKLDPAGTISGTVTDTATGAPVPEVCVTVTPAGPRYVNPYQPHCTSSEGKYTLSGLGPYAWRVQFPDASSRYAWEWSGDKSDRFAAQPVPVQPGGTTTVNAELSPPGKVTGRITGMTLPPQYVTIYSLNALTGDWAGTEGTVTSDAQYTLSGLNTQSILIDFAATTQGLQRHPTPVAVTAGQTTNVDLQAN